jgi:hypothetical protein
LDALQSARRCDQLLKSPSRSVATTHALEPACGIAPLLERPPRSLAALEACQRCCRLRPKLQLEPCHSTPRPSLQRSRCFALPFGDGKFPPFSSAQAAEEDVQVSAAVLVTLPLHLIWTAADAPLDGPADAPPCYLPLLDQECSLPRLAVRARAPLNDLGCLVARSAIASDAVSLLPAANDGLETSKAAVQSLVRGRAARPLDCRSGLFRPAGPH